MEREKKNEREGKTSFGTGWNGSNLIERIESLLCGRGRECAVWRISYRKWSGGLDYGNDSSVLENQNIIFSWRHRPVWTIFNIV